MTSQSAVNLDSSRYNSLLDSCVKSLSLCKKLIDQNLEDDQDGEMAKLKNIAKDYCEIEFNTRKTFDALNKLEDTLKDKENDEDAQEIFKRIMQEDDSEENYMENDIWLNLFENEKSVREIVTKEKKYKASQYVEVNDSLQFADVFKPPVDPISKGKIQNPYKNKKCGHVYEKDSIFGYIKSMQQRAKCPYIGCNKDLLTRQGLVEDTELKEKIDEYIRSMDSSTSDED